MRADVCMITEGSYPYVVGGVSTWVHDLISSMPDISFAVMHIGVSKDLAQEVRYKLPANVVDFRNLYLMESVPFMKMTLRPRRAAWAALEREIQEIVDGKTPSLDHLLDRFSPGRPDALTPYDIFHGKGFWDILVRLYRRHLPTFSFLDYFWTLRFIALPLFRVLYAEVPEASLYHATCTGYAGLLGAIASRRNRSPLIITEHGIYTKVAALGIYVTVSLVWVEMVFLSAAKDYAHVVLAFALGYLTSFLAAQFLGAIYQLNGMVFGFLIGQVLLSALLVQRIFADYRFGQGFNFNFLGHFRTYPTLALIGFTYNLAIWIDKVIMWYSPSGTRIHSVFYTHFPYDSAMFLAYMSIIPTLAVFLLRIETDFFVRYKNYYGSIKARAPLDVIEARRREMTDVLGSALYTVLIYQGTVTAIALLAMPYIVSIIGVDPVYAPVFRVGVVGAFFHAGVLIIMILLLYFDFRGAGLVLATVFLLTNSVFTALTTGMPQWTMGYGYTCSTMLTLGLGVLLLSNRLKRLEYLTFMRQPIR